MGQHQNKAKAHSKLMDKNCATCGARVMKAGGLSILLGYRAKIGVWLIVLFLVSVVRHAQLLGRCTIP